MKKRLLPLFSGFLGLLMLIILVSFGDYLPFIAAFTLFIIGPTLFVIPILTYVIKFAELVAELNFKL